MNRRNFIKSAGGILVPAAVQAHSYLPHRRKAFRASIITSGLVGRWTFDAGEFGSGAGEVTDSSPNGNDGTQNGGVTTTTGHNGAAAVFDASSKYINVPNSGTLNASGAYTLLAWVYPTSLANYGGIIVKGNSTPANSQYELANDNAGKLYFQSGAASNAFSSASALSTSSWQHVAIRISGASAGGTAEFYISGTYSATKTLVANLTQNTTAVSIGRYDSGFPFVGWIDDARIYNRYLDAAEILAIANDAG